MRLPAEIYGPHTAFLLTRAGIEPGMRVPRYLAELARSMLPVITAHGLATEDEADVDTLAKRIAEEMTPRAPCCGCPTSLPRGRTSRSNTTVSAIARVIHRIWRPRSGAARSPSPTVGRQAGLIRGRLDRSCIPASRSMR